MVGYTWWPMFALVTWAFRQGTHPPAWYLKQMGFWDLRPAGDGELQRVATPLVEEYRSLANRGAEAAGPLRAASPKKSAKGK